MHMCGCVEKFLPRLIELGLDVYDVVQPTAPEMDIAVLEGAFGDRLTFCGSVCVQTTLAWGTPADVEREVRRRLDCFPRAACSSAPRTPSRSARRWRTSWPCTARPAACARRSTRRFSTSRRRRQPDKINMSKLF